MVELFIVLVLIGAVAIGAAVMEVFVLLLVRAQDRQGKKDG